MNAAEFNARYPIGTPVFAYPGCRPEDDANDERLVTFTRSKAEVLGGHTDVVWVDGHGACIALAHIDVRADDDAPVGITNPALAAGIAELGVPLSADWAPQPATPRWHQLRTELIRTFRPYMPETAATKAVDTLDEVITEALLEGTAEIRRLKDELERRTEDLAFLERTTLPELRRTIQRHEDGKKRWRDRAEKAEGERARFKAAWQSARFRAQAYSEGILRVVSDREQYQVWLKQAEAKLLKLQYGCETPESHLHGCSCIRAGGAS